MQPPIKRNQTLWSCKTIDFMRNYLAKLTSIFYPPRVRSVFLLMQTPNVTHCRSNLSDTVEPVSFAGTAIPGSNTADITNALDQLARIRELMGHFFINMIVILCGYIVVVAVVAFLPGLFWGWLYSRHRTLVGVSHMLVGVWALYFLSLSASPSCSPFTSHK